MGSIYGLGTMLLSLSNAVIGCEDIRNEFFAGPLSFKGSYRS